MNLLVTGGAGFIGSHFVLRHKERFPDDTLVVLDSLSVGSDKTFLTPVIDRLRFIQGDVADVTLMTEVVARYGIEVIVNFAAETHVDRSIANAVPFIHSNILGVQSLIELLRKHPELRLLHVSTDEVYGDVKDDEASRVPADPLRPSSPYSASKAAGDLLLLSAMRTYRIPAAISRCTNNYGPHQNDEKLIPTIIRHARKNESIPVYGTGKNKRDWLYVTDHCDALETMLTLPSLFTGDEPLDHIAHVSADAEKENLEVVKTVLQMMGKPESLISFVSDRPGHDWRYSLDSSGLRTHGWKPSVSFAQGIEKTVNWYLGHSR